MRENPTPYSMLRKWNIDSGQNELQQKVQSLIDDGEEQLAL